MTIVQKLTGVNEVKQALNEVIEARRLDLAAREDVWRTWSKKFTEANGMLESARREVTKANDDLRVLCISYLALIEGKVLMSDHPCRPYVQEYKRMTERKKGGTLDRT